MLDPFPPPSPLLASAVQPLATFLSLPTLPLHAHEILLAATAYQCINAYISPFVSSRLFPTIYPQLPRRTRINWNVHAVSLCQSLLINTLALWVLWRDDERRAMGLEERVWGYTGASGMIQGLATGYFLWDLVVTAMNPGIFGWGMLAHAVSALVVFSFGFRPLVNYYGPIFILYELSSPLLNFHWFFDKLNMTGSRAQLYNGLALLATFFGCRLVWGTYHSVMVTRDVYQALRHNALPNSTFPGIFSTAADKVGAHNATVIMAGQGAGAARTALQQATDADAEVMRFAGARVVPVWLAVTYLTANVVLNSLNVWWFSKMIDAVKKRFVPAKGGKGKGIKGVEPAKAAPDGEATQGVQGDEKAADRALQALGFVPDEDGVIDGSIERSVDVDEYGHTVVNVRQTKVRRRHG